MRKIIEIGKDYILYEKLGVLYIFSNGSIMRLT